MKRWIGIVVAWAGLGSAALAQTNGIFADFTTSMGNFTVWLDHERAPRAVAGFVGLATGETGWLDERSNVWHRPFYDGSIFHRIFKNTNGTSIAIQGGGYLWRSVNTNTGVVTTNFSGPGYAMLENVTNGLSHSNGVISMANSGPNTDGSQFFIAVTNWFEGDGSYSVFGHVVSGLGVVTSIAAVAVQGSGARPVADVALSNVVIRRVGTAAEAFDVAAQGVPAPESAPVRVSSAGTSVVFAVELAAQTKPLMLSDATNAGSFAGWDHQTMIPGLAFYTNATQVLTQTWAVADLGARHFFHASRIRYPVPITAPASQRGRTFTFKWDDPDLTYSVTFSSNAMISGTGWVQEGTNAPVARTIFIGDSWSRDAYMGRLYFIDDLAREYSYNLGFNPGQPTNRFTGTWGAYGSGVRYSMTGTFTGP